MAEAPAPASAEDGLSVLWNFSDRRSRKSGYSNIFTGVNLHQLHRLFRTAGDGDAEHRAKLVWRGMDGEIEGAEEERDDERDDIEEEAGLAQALVGLRVRARNKAGIRAEGHRDHKTWSRASEYLRAEEPLSGYSVGDEEANVEPCPEEFLLAAEGSMSENQQSSKTSSWRLGVARQEGVRDSDRYLHHVIH